MLDGIVLSKTIRQIECKHMTSIARKCISTSMYRLKAHSTLAPKVVDCSSFTQWLYSLCGIDVPRLAYQQFEFCYKRIPARLAQPGDLVFRGVGHPRAYYVVCPAVGVCHVGFVTMNRTVIHAASKSAGIVETSIDRFFCYESSGLCAGRLFV